MSYTHVFTVAVDSYRSKHLVTHLNCGMRNLYNSTQLHTKTYTMSVYKEKTKVFDIYIQPFLVNEFFHTDLQLKLNQTVTLHPSIIHCYSQSRRMGAAPLPRSTRLHAYAASRLCSSKILFWCVWGGGERENDLFQGVIYSVIFLFF